MFRAAHQVMASLQRTKGFSKNWLRRTVTSLYLNSQEPWRPPRALSPMLHPSIARQAIAKQSAERGTISAQAWVYLQKKSLVATERLRARVKHLRQEWFKYRIPKMQAHPDRLVFIPSHRCKQ